MANAVLEQVQLPEALRELEAEILSGDSKVAVRRLIQTTRQSREGVEAFVASLSLELGRGRDSAGTVKRNAKVDWSRLLVEHAEVVAPLLGDPPPSAIRALDKKLPEVLRYLRRGQKLKALEIVRQELGLASGTAQKLCMQLTQRAHCIPLVLRLYQNPSSGNPFSNWPPAAPPVQPESELFVLPSEFRFEELDRRLRGGDVRAAVALVRRFAQASSEYARTVVDSLEDHLVANPQLTSRDYLSRKFPAVYAKLDNNIDAPSAGKLAPVKAQILQYLSKGQRLAASRLIEERLGVSSREARRVCRVLEPKPVTQEAPAVEFTPVPAVAASVLQAGQYISSAKETTVEKVVSKTLEEVSTHLDAIRVDHRHQTAINSQVGSEDFFHSDTHDITESVAINSLTLDEATHRFEEILEVLDRQGLAQAKRLYQMLEKDGFNRAWVVHQMPMLGGLLPPEPWVDQIPTLAEHFRTAGRGALWGAAVTTGAELVFGGASGERQETRRSEPQVQLQPKGEPSMQPSTSSVFSASSSSDYFSSTSTFAGGTDFSFNSTAGSPSSSFASSVLSSPSSVGWTGGTPTTEAAPIPDPVVDLFAQLDEVIDEQAQGTKLEGLANKVEASDLQSLANQLKRAIEKKDLVEVRGLAQQLVSLPGGEELLESCLPPSMRGKNIIPKDLSGSGLVQQADSFLETHYKHTVVGEVAGKVSAEDVTALVGQIRQAIKTGDAELLRPALETILGAVDGEKYLREQLPVVGQWFGDERITVEAVMGQLAHPRNALLNVLRRKNPKLLDEIDLEKLDKLVENLPSLKEWFRRGQLHKASVFLFKELRLGPADISDLIKVIREIL